VKVHYIVLLSVRLVGAMARFILNIVLFGTVFFYAGVGATFSPAIGQQFSNAYTRLNLDRCRKLNPVNFTAEGPVYRCKGFQNKSAHDIYLYEHDRHFYVSYGQDALEQLAAKQTIIPENSLADDLEWRLERRGGAWHPFALILRYFTEIKDDHGYYRGEVLAVMKIGKNEACHAVYIDAEATVNANRVARQAADRIVRRFDCNRDELVVEGVPGRSLKPVL